MSLVRFSVFHMDTDAAAAVQPFVVKGDYHDMVNLAFRSAAVFHPDCSLTLLTDEHTARWPGLPDAVQVKRGPSEPRLMLTRLDAEIGFVRDAEPAELLVSIDGDVLVNSSFAGLADGSWDVALTYRADDEFPINGGVAYVDGRRREAALAFLGAVRDRYAEDHSEGASWWGHQRALIEALGRRRFAARTSDVLEVDGTIVRLLPCDPFNFSPDRGGRALASPLKTKRLLHFKGPRKEWIRPYWNAHLAWREAATPTSLARAALSRARFASQPPAPPVEP